ncbi:glycosyltransferase family 9 protein [Vibrio fujianensis]|uniref:glycosyltransferase family 9 protein n=1 Tax=Vibrio fujianensis TaxID=1974215 RepID=UPI000C16B3DD|nr:glycosyltransferase family 9 protein [Vibrio fujianensis]
MKSLDFNPNKEKTALIIHISGIGDVISGLYVTNPIISKGFKVSYLILPELKGLFSNSGINEYFPDCLPNENFDLIIDLTSDNKSRRLINKLNSKYKIGRYRNLWSLLKNKRYYKKQVKKYPGYKHPLHIAFDFYSILDFFKLEEPSGTYLEFKTDKKNNDEICIHVGARNRLRCIPFNLIIELCKYFKKEGLPVRLIGNEMDIIEEVLKNTDNYPSYDPGDLSKVKEQLFCSQLVIAPDSGIFHLASALGTKCIGLYGPNTYARSGSINNNAHCIELDFPCRPCNQNMDCSYNIRCLNSITMEHLLPLIKNILNINDGD